MEYISFPWRAMGRRLCRKCTCSETCQPYSFSVSKASITCILVICPE
jgi:hypothetical protein